MLKKITPLIVLLASLFILAPVNWEPGMEGLKNWAMARNSTFDFSFPVIHHGPLYNLYLQLFLLLPYPINAVYAHAVVQIFNLTCLFFLLNKFTNRWVACLLIMPWIPHLWILEGGGRVLGMGFFALYLGMSFVERINRGIIPLTLLCASLCDLFYAPFLMGHIFGRLYQYKKLKLSFSIDLVRLIKLLLLSLIVLTLLFQSKRPENNVHGFDYPWTPVAIKNIFTAGVIQVANWKYIKKNYNENEWYKKDWYNLNDEATGGAKNIYELFKNDYKQFIISMLEEIRTLSDIVPGLIIGFYEKESWQRYLFIPILNLLIFIGFIKLMRLFSYNKQELKNFSMIVGMGSAFFAYVLVYASTRYILPFLPIALLITINISDYIFNLLPLKSKNSTIKLLIISIFSILVFLSEYRFIYKNIKHGSHNPLVFHGPLVDNHSILLATLSPDKKIIALEEPWIRAFGNINPDNLKHIYYLPPFENLSGNKLDCIGEFNVIWISENLKTPKSGFATQAHLRYKNCLENILTELEEMGWRKIHIEGFGDVYSK